MPRALDPTERYSRARAAIAAANAELATLPPAGRERTAVIARTRRHLLAARTVLAPLLHRRTGVDPQAQRIMAEIDRLWPSPRTGK